MIYYLVKIRNIDIEDKDSSGNTPLHWAVFTGSENSVNFLLALKANPNSINNDIFTPLHLSVKSIEDYGSDRIIKNLLLEGANRTMIDMDHKMAIDYVELIKDPYISNDLIRILSNPKSWQWCMLRTPLKKVRRSKKMLILFQLLISLNWILLILVLYPYENISFFYNSCYSCCAFVDNILNLEHQRSRIHKIKTTAWNSLLFLKLKT